MERDLFGEKHPIVKRAREIARTRQPGVTPPLIEGFEEKPRGYVVYEDFKGCKLLVGESERQAKDYIREILRKAGWIYCPIPHGKTIFYEPIREV